MVQPAEAINSVNYVLANNSFSFTAPVLIVTDPGTFHIGADAEGKLLLMDIDEGAASNAVRWAQACESVACAGIVYYNLNDYITSVEHTWARTRMLASTDVSHDDVDRCFVPDQRFPSPRFRSSSSTPSLASLRCPIFSHVMCHSL